MPRVLMTPGMRTTALLLLLGVWVVAAAPLARADEAVPVDNAPADNATVDSGTAGRLEQANAAGDVTFVEDQSGRRLVLIYVIFWVLIAAFAGRVVWQLVRAADRLGGKVPPATPPPSLRVAPEDDPDNPFRTP